MLSYIRYKISWWKWLLTTPIKIGDRSLGSGDLRRANIELMIARHNAKEPVYGKETNRV